ncbi:hypothetical protein TNCV_4156941 [Trichonephila clavipes]|nr:hypothetical protein TNCV_4156941 [Trichonephila clavipes]
MDFRKLRNRGNHGTAQSKREDESRSIDNNLGALLLARLTNSFIYAFGYPFGKVSHDGSRNPLEPAVLLQRTYRNAWERVTLFGGVRETHSPNSVSCKQQEQGRFHVGIDGDVKANSFARTAIEERVSPNGSSTFNELSSLKKSELNQLERTLPSHSWYFGRNPGGSFKLIPRKYQIVFSRFVISHINALTLRQGQKIFSECHWCYSKLESPAHILTCLDF